MERQKQRRKRGVILTDVGLHKLTNAKHQAESLENDGAKFTLEELSFRTQLAPFTISKVLAGEEAVDKETLEYFFYAFNLDLTQDDYTKPGSTKHTKIEKNFLNQGLKSKISDFKSERKYFKQKTDWGEAVDVSIFFGRFQELTQLENSIVNSNCRLVALLGMGGVGKTSVSVKLAQQLEEKFEFVVWRSLRNSQTLEELLKSLLQFCAQGENINISENIGELISQFIGYLRLRRYLIIIDNAESILASGDNSGYYQTGYEDYGQFWQQIAETPHQSCLLLTSREKPREIAALEGETLPVRSLNLEGLGEDAALELLQTKGFFSSYNAEWQYLIHHYGGNPLALKIVATTIRELFDGDVKEFCSQGTMVFGSIYDLLSQQFHRLSDLEKDLLYWLAINREPVTLKKLRADFVLPVSPMKMLEALESLSRRSLIEKSKNLLDNTNSTSKSTGTSTKFTLQPVVMEYVTRRLIQQVTKEIEDKTRNLNVPAFAPSFAHKTFNTHALIQATAKDYIGITQTKLILQPVIEQLLLKLHHKQGIKTTLTNILYELQQTNFDNIVSSPNPVLEPGYAAGNILNLLCQTQTDLRGYNLSYLSIWQAYFQETPLQKVNFSHSDLSNSVFAKTFGVAMSAVFSPDGKTLVTGHSDGSIFLWNVYTSELLTNYQAHKGPIWSLIYINDSTFVSTSHDGSIKFWDISTGQCIKTLRGHQGSVYNAVFAPDGKILISSGADCTIRLWDIANGECIRTLKARHSWIGSVAYFSEFNSSKFNPSKLEPSRLESSKPIQSDPSGEQIGLIASGSEDSIVRLWNLQTLDTKSLRGHTEYIFAVEFSPDGKIIASGSADLTIRLWDVETGECIKVLRGHKSLVTGLAFTTVPANLIGLQPKCGYLLASTSYDRTVRLWDPLTGELLHTLPEYYAMSVDFSPDGKSIAVGNFDDTVRIWDLETKKCRQSFKGDSILTWRVAFHPQRDILATANSADMTVRLWDITTGKCMNIFSGHTNWILGLTFSPDGNLLASCSSDRTIKLWDVVKGECIVSIDACETWVMSVVFSSDGKTLISSDGDSAIKVWDVETFQCLQTLKIPRLYENMNLYKTTGLTEAQKTTLQELGSISVYG